MNHSGSTTTIFRATTTTDLFHLMMLRNPYLITGRRRRQSLRRDFRLALSVVLIIAFCGCGERDSVLPMAQAQTEVPPAANANAAENPYQHRVPAPPLVDAEWVNTATPLSLADLRGRFVLLDF